VLGIDKYIFAPKPLADLLPADYVPSASRMSNSMGMRSSFRARPFRRSSKRAQSSSNSPNSYQDRVTAKPQYAGGSPTFFTITR
jgi:hypothetical protein